MAKAKESPLTDVGVIVGRFHVHELHQGHKDLINFVLNRHSKVIVFLGLSPCKSTVKNPLDFETRKQLLLQHYPDLIILYIKDQKEDAVWSKNLEEQIGDVVSPTQTVTLYGSRDSFISHYSGKYKCIEMEQEVFSSGTDVRKTICNKIKSSSDFRAGAIWATSNQYPKAIPTVDIAIFNDDYSKLLLARKSNEEEYRFVGGFVSPGENYETAAKREVIEETHLEVGDLKYICSEYVDDWRYKKETDKITTAFFIVKVIYGRPTPDDDIAELKWFSLTDIKENMLVPNHRILFNRLQEYMKKENV